MKDQPNSNSYDIDPKKLDRFIHMVSDVFETPELIQKIAESEQWIKIAGTLANVVPEKEISFWQQFSKICEKNHLDPIGLKERIVPAARSLGLFDFNSQIQDHYALLGIDPYASSGEIRKAYHRKAKLLHPDTRKNGKDDRAFIRLTDGYRILKNPALKRDYDKSCHYKGSWYEGGVTSNDDRNKMRWLSGKIRYMLQIVSVVLFLFLIIAIFNWVYESQVLDDLYRPALQPERGAPDSDKKGTAETKRKSDRRLTLKSEAILREEEVPADSDERMTALSSIEDKNKKKPVLTGNPYIDRKILGRYNFSFSSSRKEIPSFFADRRMETDSDAKRERLSTDGAGKKDDAIEENKASQTTQSKNVDISGSADIPAATEKMKTEDRIDDKSKHNSKKNLMGIEDNEINSIEMLHKFAEEDAEIKRVFEFLEQYSKIYERKDYSAFSLLFTEDATENGEAFADMADDYRRIFSALEKLKYRIELHRTLLFIDRNVIRVDGIYKLVWQPHEGIRRESNGPISFEIVKCNGQYRIRKLTYGKIIPK